MNIVQSTLFLLHVNTYLFEGEKYINSYAALHPIPYQEWDKQK